MDSFKAGWEQQRQEIAGRRKKEISFGDAPENCGLASLQKMAGEDDAAAERRKLQTDQVGVMLEPVQDHTTHLLMPALFCGTRCARGHYSRWRTDATVH